MFIYGKGQDRHPFLVCLSCPYSTASQSRYWYFHFCYHSLLLSSTEAPEGKWKCIGSGTVDCMGDDGKRKRVILSPEPHVPVLFCAALTVYCRLVVQRLRREKNVSSLGMPGRWKTKERGSFPFHIPIVPTSFPSPSLLPPHLPKCRASTEVRVDTKHCLKSTVSNI